MELLNPTPLEGHEQNFCSVAASQRLVYLDSLQLGEKPQRSVEEDHAAKTSVVLDAPQPEPRRPSQLSERAGSAKAKPKPKKKMLRSRAPGGGVGGCTAILQLGPEQHRGVVACLGSIQAICLAWNMLNKWQPLDWKRRQGIPGRPVIMPSVLDTGIYDECSEKWSWQLARCSHWLRLSFQDLSPHKLDFNVKLSRSLCVSFRAEMFYSIRGDRTLSTKVA
eukprot:Skav205933  [mRNA]  locus=scaffold2739:91578:97498:- [translate_table: standard]